MDNLADELQSIDEDRCKRCRQKIEDHAKVEIASAGVAWICPTTDGHAVSDELCLQTANTGNSEGET